VNLKAKDQTVKDRSRWTELEEICWATILEELPSVKRGDLKLAREIVQRDAQPKSFEAVDFLEYSLKLSKVGQNAEADKYLGDPDEMLANFAAGFAALWWREPAVLAQSMVDEENLKLALVDNPFVSFERHLVMKAQVLRLDLRPQEAEAILEPLFESLLRANNSEFVNAGWLLAEIQFERQDEAAAVATLQKMVSVLETDESKTNILAETRRRMKPGLEA
jgi:tetratricopeptide (TPR) repeat protein